MSTSFIYTHIDVQIYIYTCVSVGACVIRTRTQGARVLVKYWLVGSRQSSYTFAHIFTGPLEYNTLARSLNRERSTEL